MQRTNSIMTMGLATGLLALAAVVAVPDALGQVDAPAAKPEAAARQTAFVVKIRAMDSGKAGRSIRQAFAQCAEANATGIVLIVSASCPWRSDVVRDVLRDMKGCKVPTMVLIDSFAAGKTRLIELGPALLGVAATQWGMEDPAVTIRVQRDEAARDQVEERVDWLAVEQEIRETIAPHATRHGWTEGHADVLTWPREEWWAVEPFASRNALTARLAKGSRPTMKSGERARVLSKDRAAEEPFASFVIGLSALRGETGEGPAKADDFTSLCKAAGLKAPMTHDLEIEGSIDDVRSRALLAHEELTQLRKQIDTALDAAEVKGLAPADAKAKGESQRKPLSRADEIIADLEATLADYPEALRTLPPGKTPTGSRPAAQPARWRSLVQNHRDAMAKLGERVDALVGAK